MPDEMTALMLASNGLQLLHAPLRAKVDRDAGKETPDVRDATKPAGADPSSPGASGAAVAPGKMSMKERIAAMQKDDSSEGSSPPKATTRRGAQKKKEPPPTLGGRLRRGIGEVKADGSGTGLMGLLSKTTTHYIRCVKPNDSMAAFGFEQPRVLQQLQYSGVVEMVRIRRSAFPGRATYANFAHTFAALCGPEGKCASGDARERCVGILEAAGLQPDQHYALGNTMVFLRNAVEGALKSRLAALGIDTEDGQTPAPPAVPAPSPAPAPPGALARMETELSDESDEEEGHMLRMSRIAGDAISSSAPPPPMEAPPPPPPTAAPPPPTADSAAADKAAAAKAVAEQAKADAARAVKVAEEAEAAAVAEALAAATAEKEAAEKAAAKAAAPPMTRKSSVRISSWWARVRQRSAVRLALDGLFAAAFGDDEDALSLGMAAFPHLLTVRQNRSGQRASLAHAAAAGGAVRVVPALMLAMHAAAIESGDAALAAELSQEEEAAAQSGEEASVARLRCAVAYGCSLRDVLGRTPLHYAARAGQHGFVQWAVRVLCTRPKAHEDSFGVRAELAAPPTEGSELRRGVLSVRLPGASGPRQRMLVSLTADALRLFAIPAGASAGSAAEAFAAEKAAEGAAELAIPCDGFFLPRNTAGPKPRRDLIELVLLRKAGAASGGGSGGDALELYAASITDARYWKAGLAQASSSHGQTQLAELVGVVGGSNAAARAPTQLELARLHALVNDYDVRGETMLHACIRGLVASDAPARSAFVAWLLQQGASLVDPDGTALDLLLSHASADDGSVNKELDAAAATLFTVAVRQSSGMVLATTLDAALTQARARFDGKLEPTKAPAVHAALHDASLSRHGADSQLGALPTAQQERLRYLLLSVEAIDGSGLTSLSTRHLEQEERRVKAPLEAVRMAIALVHEPAAESGAGNAGDAGEAGASGNLDALKSIFGGGIGASRGGAKELGALVRLDDESLSAPAVSLSSDRMLWRAAWTCMQLPGEEAAMVLLQIVHPEAKAKGAERLVGWVAVSVGALGEHHVQLRPPPLPQSAAEARAAGSAELLDVWVHLELNSAVTGSVPAASTASRFGTAASTTASGQSRPRPPLGASRMRSVIFSPRSEAAAEADGARPPSAEQVAPPQDRPSVVDGLQTVVTSVGSTVGPVVDAVVPKVITRAVSRVGGTAVNALSAVAPNAVSAVAAVVAPPAAGPLPDEGGATAGASLPAEQRAMLEALTPKTRGKLPARKWGKQPSRDEQYRLLTATAAAAACGEFELALRGYMRAFEISRATPLLLSIVNVHLKLGEVDHADAFCTEMRALSAEALGLSAEQKAVLARKEKEIVIARQKSKAPPQAAPPMGLMKGVSAWQQGVDQAQLEKLA